MSPTRDAQAAKRFFMKARHSTADSVPGAHPAEEQVAQPTAPANPTTPTPRVINVEKNAAYPKAEASLKAVGMLPASVELRSPASSEWRPKHNKNGEPLAMAFLCEFLQHNRSAYPHLKTVRSG